MTQAYFKGTCQLAYSQVSIVQKGSILINYLIVTYFAGYRLNSKFNTRRKILVKTKCTKFNVSLLHNYFTWQAVRENAALPNDERMQ